MPFLTDTHCHLYLQDYDIDFKEIVDRAYAGGVHKILIPGIDLQTCQQLISLSKKHPGFLFAAIGIHPNYSSNIKKTELIILESLVSNPNVKAIGEIGLDFYREKASVEDQIKIFKEMLKLSRYSGKPVCIHNRNADSEIIKILDTWYSDLILSQSILLNHPGVFHSYNGSEIISRWALSHNFYLGISGSVTFSKSKELQEKIKDISICNLLIETDSPYLSPHPFRGKRNEPMHVKLIAEKIAKIKQMEFSEVVEKTSENAKNLFSW